LIQQPVDELVLLESAFSRFGSRYLFKQLDITTPSLPWEEGCRLLGLPGFLPYREKVYGITQGYGWKRYKSSYTKIPSLPGGSVRQSLLFGCLALLEKRIANDDLFT